MILGLDYKEMKQKFESQVFKQESTNMKISSVVNKKIIEDFRDNREPETFSK